MVLIVTLLWINIVLLIIYYKCSITVNRRTSKSSIKIEPIDVIITSKENIVLLNKCIESILSYSFVNRIWICLDNPSPETRLFAQSWRNDSIDVLINTGKSGKIPTQLMGVRAASTAVLLLIDADIRIVTKDENIRDMLHWRSLHKADFLCPYTYGLNINNRYWAKIAECDRVMRQRILRAGRDVFGLSNLSGYFLVALKEAYLKVVQDKIQDDVAATIRVAREGLIVRTFPLVIGSELEKAGLWKSLMQRARWTYGNLLLTPKYITNAPRLGLSRGIILLTMPYMWYGMHYIIFFSSLILFFQPALNVIIPLIMNLALQAVILLKTDRKLLSPLSVIGYILFWHVFSVSALFLGIIFRVFNLDSASRER